MMKMYLKSAVLALPMLLFSAGVFAQAHDVTGTVLDEESNPIPGANVLIKGTTTGTITTGNGEFQMKANDGDVLQISYIGYTTEEITVSGNGPYNISLVPDMVGLDEVVVVGYGVQRKSDVTGAIATVSEDALKNRSTSDAGAALQGKAAGVQIISNSGKPGEGAQIRVRGVSSNQTNNGNLSPLLIVDGLIVDNIQYLDPSMIESMEVLKDAASAAIYGAQAGNGVVLITTKNGSKSKGSGTIKYDGKWTLQSLGNVPELLNAKEFVEWMKFLGEDVDKAMADAKTAFGWDEKTDTDWMKEYFENTWAQQHSVSVTGGNERGNYFASINYLNQDGIVKGHKDVYERLTAQLNGEYKIKDWLKVGNNTSIEKWSSRGVSERGYGTAFQTLLMMDPLTPTHWTKPEQFIQAMKKAYDEAMTNPSDTTYRFYGDEKGFYATSYFNQRQNGGNPFIQRDRAFQKQEGITVRGSIHADFTPVKWLTYTTRFGYRLSNSTDHNWDEPYYVNSKANHEGFSITATANTGIYYMWENFMNFNKTFADVHNVSAMVGMSFTESSSDNVTAGANGSNIMNSYKDNYRFVSQVNRNPETSRTTTNQPSLHRNMSYFGRASYSFADRYNLQFILRADAFDTSKLDKDHRWGKFPSVSAGWTISNEDFIRSNVSDEILSYLKLRASWGRNGNVSVLNDYKYKTGISENSKYYQTDDGKIINGSAPSGVANPDLTWETSDQVDVGLDMRFLSNRLSLGIDYYNKKTKDLLFGITTPSEAGSLNTTVNGGEILNTGIEIEAAWRHKIGDINYSISANMATLKNEATYLTPLMGEYQNGAGVGGSNFCKLTTRFKEGEPIWYMHGYKYTGIKPDGTAGFADLNGDGNVDEHDMTNVGYGNPKVTYGLTINLDYKGIDFLLFGTGAAGRDIYYGLYYEGYNNISKYFYDEMKKGNLPSDIAKSDKYWTSDAAVFNGSYFKIKQIQLGYTLPKELSQKVFIQNARCFVSLDDFFTITKYPGLDPETANNGANGPGMDLGQYPTMRKVVFGVNLTF